jgi:hypothetical protein
MELECQHNPTPCAQLGQYGAQELGQAHHMVVGITYQQVRLSFVADTAHNSFTLSVVAMS